MLRNSIHNQMIYILLFNILILIGSGIRIGNLWIDRNKQHFQVLVGHVVDPMIILFIYSVLIFTNVLCFRGTQRLHKTSFIPYLLVTPFIIIAVLLLSGLSFNQELGCIRWLASWECFCYPILGIGWSILNIYLFVITIKRFKEISSDIQHDVLQKPMQNHISYPHRIVMNYRNSNPRIDYIIISDPKHSLISP